MRIPIVLLAITAYLYGSDGGVRWLYVGFVVNSLILLNALIGLQARSVEPAGEDKQQVRERQGYDRGLRRIAVAVMNLDLVDWLNNSVLLILFLALDRLDLYLWTSLVFGLYAVLMKIARQYLLHRILSKPSPSR